MKTKLTIRMGVAAVITLCALAGLAATDEPRRVTTYTPGNYDAPPTEARRPATLALMRGKLVYSQGILEGLALEKFDLVSKNALHLRNMTRSNLWYLVKQPAYMRHMTNYQENVDALYAAAVARNLDAATEAYTKIARNCVECHRVVRLEQRRPAMSPKK